MPEPVTAISSRNVALLPLGRAIVGNLVPAENAIDAAIADSSTLLATVAHGRIQSGLAAELGEDSIASILRCIAALGTARAEMVTGHRHLANIRDANSMSAHDFGCSGTKRVGRRRSAEAA